MSHTVPLSRLEKTARWGRRICEGTMLVVAAYLLFLAFTPQEALAVLRHDIPGIITLPGSGMILAAEMAALCPVLLFLYGLWQARKLFGLIGRRYFLAPESQRLMMHLGYLAIAGALLAIFSHTAVVLAMTSANPPGQKMLEIAFSSGEVTALIIAILFFTFALLLKEAAAIEEENRSII